jgi:hypothetical protein
MKIDTDHLHYWMCAIRESKNPIRTLDAFWKGQISSKEWLIKNLKLFVTKEVSIDIHGGWVGVLASMLFQSTIPIKNIRTIDIDPECEPIAITMNKQEYDTGKFQAITANMSHTVYNSDIIINTCCEHITQEQYELWLSKLPKESLIVLQCNNYQIPEHIRTAETLKEFKEQSHLRELWSGNLRTQLYDRWMLIGHRNV